IKLYGDDLTILRNKAKEMKSAIEGIPGVKDLLVEQQVDIPQLQINLRRDELARYGLSVADVNAFVETAMNGRTVSEVLRGQRTFDCVVRLDEQYRRDPEALRRLIVNVPGGSGVPLSRVADIVTSASGPNTINRENVRRRIVVQCNTAGRDLASVVTDIQKRLEPIQESLPTGYFLEYGGQIESPKYATPVIGVFSMTSPVCI